MSISKFRVISVFATALSLLGGNGCDDGGNNNAVVPAISTTTTIMGDSTTTTRPNPTTTSTTSTTTISDFAFVCNVRVAVTSGETLGSLQFNLDYSAPGAQPGGFEGSADTVNCFVNPALTGSIVTFNDDEPAQTLRTGIISLAGFTGPTGIQDCAYIVGSGPGPTADDFVVTLVDAADPAFVPQTPTLEVEVDCPPFTAPTTTTTSTTTTSISHTTTTTLPPVPVVDIVFQVDQAGPYGALQYNVDYSAVAGSFVGNADSVSCTAAAGVAGSIVTFNDDDAASTLRTGIISLAGFAGPTALATCSFFDTAGEAIPGNFVITVVDASDPALAPIVPLPTVSIVSITEGS